ncbi:MAG: hypothetical protein KDA17_00625 [Candidatus Saccharibacteria bacterium]|nr:hypothetical protein [Candidatus Saccharibacteria bacterium]
MKPRTRPIKNLYFRWGQGFGLTPIEIAEVLEREGLIELTPERTHYRETEKATQLPPYMFDEVFCKAIVKEVLKKEGVINGNK